MEKEFKEHQSTKFGELTFQQILDANKNNLINYKDYNLIDRGKFIMCCSKNNSLKNGEVYFFSKYNLFDFILKKENNEVLVKKKISSTYEIKLLLENYDKKTIFFEEEVYAPQQNYLLTANTKNEIIFFFIEEKLDEFVGNCDKFQQGIKMDLKNLSNFWNLYFKNEKSGELEYYNSEEKDLLKKIFDNLQLNDTGFNFFRFTGPVGIGKSLFLFNHSRTSINVVYLNLKILSKQTNPIKMKNILINEFNYINTSDEKTISNIKSIFEDKNLIKYEDIITKIISSIHKNSIFNVRLVIILDQFKSEVFSKIKEIEDIISTTTDSPVKIIVCSSIDDGPIRESCLSLWSKLRYCKDKNNYYKDKDFQKLYHYIPKLIDKKIKSQHNIEIYNIICELFNNIPKYAIKFLNTEKENLNDKLNKVTEQIIYKIKRFFRTIKKEKDESNIINSIVSLKKYINKIFDISNLEIIASNFPLKFFTIKFYSLDKKLNLLINNIEQISYFKIEYSFLYLKDILDELTLKNQKSFFSNDDYQIHTGSTVGGFFEISAIEGLKNQKFLPKFDKNTIIMRVQKINEMNKYDPILRDEIKNKIKSVNEPIGIEIDNNPYIKSEIISGIDEKSIFPKLNEEQKVIYNRYLYKDKFLEDLIDSYINKLQPIIKNKNGDIYAIPKYDKNFKKIKLFQTTNNKEDKIEENKNIIIIENDDNRIYKYKDYNILMIQSIENAPAFDAAYLFGNHNNKIFIGFQMKAYKDRDNGSSISINKEEIKENYCQFLLTSKYFLDINITEFHFIVVGLHFQNNENNKDNDESNNNFKNYSDNLIKHCQKNNLKIILYDPKKNQFFADDKINILPEIILDNFSNINNTVEISETKLSNAIIGKKTQRMIKNDFEDFFLGINKERKLKKLSEKKAEGVNEEKANEIKDEMIEGITDTMKDFFEQLKKLFNFSIIYFEEKRNFDDFGKYSFYLPSENNIYLFKKRKGVDDQNIEQKSDNLNNFLILKLENDSYKLYHNKIIIKAYDTKIKNFYYLLLSELIPLIDNSLDFWIFRFTK